MKKNKNQLIISLVFILACNCFLVPTIYSQQPSATYPLSINYVDKDNSFKLQELQLQTTFNSQVQCYQYVSKLPALLASRGYPTASVDSSWFTESGAGINLFFGKQYQWIKVQPVGVEKKALDESGFRQTAFNNKAINIPQLLLIQQRMLNYYENNGHPFAEVFLDSVQIDNDNINALLKVNTGVLYHLDSIRLFGKTKISKRFLYHYLGMPKGSEYNKEKMQQVDKRIQQLPYMMPAQPSNITMLGSGSILNLYLAPKRSSQIDVLVGLLPGDGITTKFQLTGDVKLNLQNALSAGETIIANWQSLQRNSQRFNLGFNQPYIFNSNFGFDFSFNLFKKDSSFLQISSEVGLQYLSSLNQSGKIFLQWQNNFLQANSVDTNLVKATKQLPPNIDVNATSVGLEYEWNKTNFRFNPRSGNEIKIYSTVGIKNVKKNDDVLSIKDPSFNYASLYDSVKARTYQVRVKISAAHYFPMGKQSTIKTSVTTGIFSSQSVFRNELFQIGGYKLLRGFSEESIYATQYVVGSVEYRLLLGLRSYLFGFTDAALVKFKYQNINATNNFISIGLGISTETKNGLLNVSYAIGKRNDVPFNIREASKIHFGYVSFF